MAPLTVFPVLAPAAAVAQDDPAAQKIAAFDDALIQTMKAGAAAGAHGRYKVITPAVDATLDLPMMTAFAVGPRWATTPADDRTALIAAFRRYTIANYAKNFDAYSGQTITLTPEVQTRGVDKLVKTQIVSPSRSVVLIYRMRQSGGSWKVIDVLFNGSISQLTIQRSDFASTLDQGGPKLLAAHLDSQADKLLK